MYSSIILWISLPSSTTSSHLLPVQISFPLVCLNWRQWNEPSTRRANPWGTLWSAPLLSCAPLTKRPTNPSSALACMKMPTLVELLLTTALILCPGDHLCWGEAQRVKHLCLKIAQTHPDQVIWIFFLCTCNNSLLFVSEGSMSSSKSAQHERKRAMTPTQRDSIPAKSPVLSGDPVASHSPFDPHHRPVVSGEMYRAHLPSHLDPAMSFHRVLDPGTVLKHSELHPHTSNLVIVPWWRLDILDFHS